MEDRLEAQREARDTVRKGFGDVREAVERARADAPEFLRRGFRRSNGREETRHRRSVVDPLILNLSKGRLRTG